MVPGDRLFCCFIKPQTLNETFTAWPLHITIVPWFRTDKASDALCRMLNQRLQSIEPFHVDVGEEARMGYDRTVNLIRTPSPLEDIEQAARALLHENAAWLVDETTQKQRAFRPHVTAQKSGRMQTGDHVTIDKVYIVEQKGDYKEITGLTAL